MHVTHSVRYSRESWLGQSGAFCIQATPATSGLFAVRGTESRHCRPAAALPQGRPGANSTPTSSGSTTRCGPTPTGCPGWKVLTDQTKVGCFVALTPTWNESAYFADYVLPMGHGPERHDTHSYEQARARREGWLADVRSVVHAKPTVGAGSPPISPPVATGRSRASRQASISCWPPR